MLTSMLIRIRHLSPKIAVNLCCSGQQKMFSSFSSKSDSSNDCLTKVIDKDGIRRIILANPKSRNSLSLAMMNEILDHLSDNDLLRCVVISAEGPVFSSGHNLKEMVLENNVTTPEKSKEIFAVCSALMKRIIELPIPIIAAVQGPALAAGCQLVTQCDIAVCTEKCTFSTPGSHFGIFCSTPGIPLARNVPKKVAAHMLMTGIPLKAEEALMFGLVNKVVSDEDQLEVEVTEICNAVKKQSKSVVSLGKQFFYQQVELDIMAAYRLGEDVMSHNVQLLDGQEGIRSFVEKRKPIWKHNNAKLYTV